MNLSYNIFGLDKITRSFGMEITEEYFEKIVYFKDTEIVSRTISSKLSPCS